MAYIFRGRVRKILVESGWKHGRRIDDSKIWPWIREAQKELGCHAFPEALRVMREFGGLVIGTGPGALHIDPNRYQYPSDREEWFQWEWDLNKILFPIGSLDNFDLSFAVASDGGIYSKGAGSYYEGPSFEIALENLFGNRTVEEKADTFREFTEPNLKKYEERIEKVNHLYRSIYLE